MHLCGLHLEELDREDFANSEVKHRPYKDHKELPNYFSFGFVRNPWDWVVSWYFYRKNPPTGLDCRTDNISFRDWLLDIKGSAYWKPSLGLHYGQHYYLEDERGNIGVDFVGRYESLQDDYSLVRDTLSLGVEVLPKCNESNHSHYTDYYDDETREFVGKRFAKDIKLFGYEYGV